MVTLLSHSFFILAIIEFYHPPALLLDYGSPGEAPGLIQRFPPGGFSADRGVVVFFSAGQGAACT